MSDDPTPDEVPPGGAIDDDDTVDADDEPDDEPDDEQ